MPENPDTDETDVIRRIIAVQGGRRMVYLLVTVYEEANAALASGVVYRSPNIREGEPEMILNVGDTLTAIWVSPAGHLWVGSANGRLWTTAPVEFAEGPDEDVPAQMADVGLEWQVTAIPKLRQKRYHPNIACLYGFSDQDIFAGTYEGAIYHWDGKTWAEMPFDNAASISKMHACDRKNLYAIGSDRLLLHFDGERWQRVPSPEEVAEGTIMMGVRVLRPGLVYACDLRGHIYKGNAADGMTIVSTTRRKWYGLSLLGRQVILASSPGGAWELVEDQPVSLRDTFSALEVFEAGAGLFFIETEQPDPSVIEYVPDANPVWARHAF